MSQDSLSGRKVVVTGGSRGIGKAVALAFAQNGASVSICARGVAALEDTRAMLARAGGTVHAARCDLSDPHDIPVYVAAAAEALGGIDILVNNATGSGLSDTEEGWDASLSVDLMAVVRTSGAAMPFLLESKSGAIVNVASISGLAASPRTPPYGAAKAAVIQYSATQASQLIRKGVRVNCVAPGAIEFPGGVWDTRRTSDPSLYEKTLLRMPLGRLGRAEEIAEMVVFLASPRASWVVGQTIVVDGGQLLTQ
ncbi:SDR family NAD(P)-dependent oxidoreductase [Microvirga antarctica]|uniref:SDR family NAD(P)-dependent oxidoreductase n=1 Tax=Microvirga antarctica TaxID=2819233 RepID=UPI001B30D688|nr:SDR family oxidoreductase [Microvirga antarctica]